jgi:MoaA/NifB/PqqE/SkfB family radical SAM enzyme
MKRSEIIKENILKSPFHFYQGIKYHLAGHFFLPKPVYFGLGITTRCNAKCIMCPMWKIKSDEEPSIKEIEQIFSDSLLNRIRTVGLSGGEPTLREDLAEIVNRILEVNHSIEWMGIITNGLSPDLLEKELQEILALSILQRLNTFSIQVSIDGYGETNDRIRGVSHAFDAAKDTLHLLKNLQNLFPFKIQILCVVQQWNIESLPELSRFARKLNIPIRYNPVRKKPENASYFEEILMPNPSQLKKVKEYFNSALSEDLDLLSLAFWKDYFSILEGRKRRVPCALPYYSLAMGGEGDMFICGVAGDLLYGNFHDESLEKIWYSQEAKQLRKKIRKDRCASCRAWCVTNLSMSLEFFYFSRFLLKSFFTKATKIQ